MLTHDDDVDAPRVTTEDSCNGGSCGFPPSAFTEAESRPHTIFLGDINTVRLGSYLRRHMVGSRQPSCLRRFVPEHGEKDAHATAEPP